MKVSDKDSVLVVCNNQFVKEQIDSKNFKQIESIKEETGGEIHLGAIKKSCSEKNFQVCT